jgi:hypothetical protein
MSLRTIYEVADHYKVSDDLVRKWIRDGTLGATDISRKGAAYRRWRVSDQHMEAFELKRSSQPQPKQPGKRKRRDIPKLV